MLTTNITDITPGDFFVSSTGFSSNLAGRVMAKLVQWGTSSTVNHAGVYIGRGMVVVEAQPGGARYERVELYMSDNTTWSKGKFLDTTTHYDMLSNQTMDPSYVRSVICQAAVKMVGTPYGYLDILAIAIAQKRFTDVFRVSPIDRTKSWEQQPWWVKRLARKDRLICSQLVDEAYRIAGVHLFNDGRLPQLVSPGDLLTLLET